ncbi:MAG: S8 family serine peptidase [Salinivirgaceae bacterium]
MMKSKPYLRRSMILLMALISLSVSGQQTLRMKFSPDVEKSIQAYEKTSIKKSGIGNIQTGIATVDRLLTKYQGIEMKRVYRPAGKFEARHMQYGLHLWYEIKLANSKNSDYQKCISEFKGLTEINTVEAKLDKQLYGSEDKITPVLNWIPNDPRYNEQWHYWNTGQTNGTPGADIRLQDAWGIQKGSNNVVVAVIDQGVDYSHEDLAGAMWVNELEATGTTGVDDDNNGYIDDVHGYGFGDNQGTYTPGEHGTHVGGTIGAVNNNGIGVSGIAGGSGSNGGVRLMSCAVFGSSNSDGFDEAFIYAADNGAVIAQNSWGYTSSGQYEQSVLDAIDYFIAVAGNDTNGVQNGPLFGGMVIFAAGNDNSYMDWYPGYYEPVLSVASTTHNDTKAWYSNYGTWVDVAAPGGETNVTEQGVLSTLPGNSYGFYQGTSMACPHVSGMAALLVSEYGGPGFSSAALRDLIITTTDSIDELNTNYSGMLGSGRINAFTALNSNDSIPPSPINDLLTTDVTEISIKLNWTSTGNDSTLGKASAYDLRYSTNPIDAANFDASHRYMATPKPKESGNNETCILTGLTPGTQYYFAIKALDINGNKPEISNVVSAETLDAPIALINPSSLYAVLDSGNTETASLYLKNIGKESLSYSIKSEGTIIISSLGEKNNTSQISFDYEPKKGETDTRKGNPVITGAGDDGVDGFGYRWIDSDESGGPKFNWHDISATGTEVYLGDDSYVEASLPFTFSFYDIDYSNVYISSNGFISFNSDGAYSLSNNQIPNTYTPNALIAAFWDDLYPNNGSSIYYQALDNNFIVQYQNINVIGNSGINTFQIILAKDGSIKIQYLQMNGPLIYSTVGIENEDGTQGLQVAFNTDYIHDSLAVSISTAPQVNFIKSIVPNLGNVAINDSVEIQLELSSDSLIPGNYIDRLIISSNDPLHPEIEFPVYLHVNGFSNALVSLDSLNYGNVFITDTTDLSFQVNNTGSDSLDISNIVSSNGAFIVHPFSDKPVYKNGKIDITVSFAPAVELHYVDTLTIYSNAMDNPATIILTGFGELPPVISVTPDSLAADLHINETEKQTLTIDNTAGESELIVSIDIKPINQVSTTIISNEKLEILKSKVSRSYTSLIKPENKAFNTAPLSANSKGSSRLFATDLNLNQIVELDPITGSVFHVIYTSNIDFWGPEGLAFDGTNIYFSDETGTIYKLNADTGAEEGTMIIGGYLDGLGFDGTYLLATDNRKDQFYKIDFETKQIVDTLLYGYHFGGGLTNAGNRGTVFAAIDFATIIEFNLETEEVVNYFDLDYIFYGLAYSNSLNQLFVADLNGQIRVLDPDNGNEISSFVGQGSALAADEGSGSKWLSTSVQNANISAGTSQEIDFTFDATDLFGGNYDSYIIINSNDPVNPKVKIPAHLHVTGVPEIEVTPDSLIFGQLFTGQTDSLTIKVINPGTDLLVIDSIYSNDVHFTPEINSISIDPKKTATLQVYYSGNEVQTDTGSLFLRSNAQTNPMVGIVLSGISVMPPIISVTPDSLAADLLTNEIEIHILTIDNSVGGSNLDITLSIAGRKIETNRIPIERSVDSQNANINSMYNSLRDYKLVPVNKISKKVSGVGNVLILYDDASDVSEIAGLLNTYPDLNISTLDADTYQVTLETLLTYKTVIVSNNGSWTDATALGNVLADFVDYGGNLIITVPVFYNGNFMISGRFLSEGYMPVNLANSIGYNELGWYNADHSIMKGIEYIYSGTSLSDATISANSEDIAEFTNQGIFVGTKGNVVALNLFIAWSGTWIGDVPALFYNTINYLSGSKWLQPDIELATIPAGTSLDINITFDATDLFGGNYDSYITIKSNDPINPVIEVPAHLHVTGVPEIEVSPASLDFGQLFTGRTDSILVTIENPGTDLLVIDTIYSTDTHFVPELHAVSIEPKDSMTIQVYYNANEVQTDAGSLFLQSNAHSSPTVEIILTGKSVLPPVIEVTPDSLAADLFTNDSVVQTITIDNSTGGSDLIYELLVERISTDEALKLKAIIDSHSKTVSTKGNSNVPLSNLPIVSPNSAGTFGTDSVLTFDNGYDGVYTSGSMYWSNDGGGHLFCGDYLVDNYIFFPSPVNISYFQMNSSPYASYQVGSGYIDVNAYDIDTNLIWSTTIDLTGTANWSTWVDVTVETNNISYLELKAPGGYPWYNGFWPSIDNIHIGSSISWLQVEPISGTVPAGSNKNIAVTFDATKLIEGEYDSYVVINSNDPVNPIVKVPAHLHVTGIAEIEVVPAQLDFGQVFQGSGNTLSILIKNIGNKPLVINEIYSTNEHFVPEFSAVSLEPTDTIQLMVHYNANELQTDAGSLFLKSNAHSSPTVEIVLAGKSVLPPVISLSSDSISSYLDVNETETQTITINNTNGGSNLNYEISVKRIDMNVISKLESTFDNNGMNGTNNKKMKASTQSQSVAAAISVDTSQTNSVLTFDTGTDGVYLSGNMVWTNDGGGHLYCSYPYGDSYVYFQNPVYISYFQMNCFPYASYPTENVGLINVEAFDINWNLIWSKEVDLTGSTDWSKWVNVTVETSDVYGLRFIAPANYPWYNYIYPSIDNIHLGNSVSWLTSETLSGSIPAGSSQNVAVTFITEGIEYGTYDAQIIVSSNDPVNSQKTVAAHLLVTNNTVPEYVSSAESLYLKMSDKHLIVNLDTMFSDADSDKLTYTVTTANNTVASALVGGNLVIVTAVSVGTIDCEIVANDGRGGVATKTMPIMVEIGQSSPDLTISGVEVFPNPFTDKVFFTFELQHPGNLQLKLYSADGRAVGMNEKGYTTRGKYTIEFNSTGLEQGVYIYNLVLNNEVVNIGSLIK